MGNIEEDYWKAYIRHVFKFEGKLSKNPNDTASKCVQPGQYHTNMGVTYCTYKNYARIFGLSPTYDSFLKMTEDDVVKFIKKFSTDGGFDDLPEGIRISMTEAAWGSGFNRAWLLMSDTLRKMGHDVYRVGKRNDKIISLIKSADKKELFRNYNKERFDFLMNLASSPKYAMFKNGWANRYNSFMKTINI